LQQQIENDEHANRHRTHEKAIEGIVRLENGESGETHIVGHLVADKSVAVEQFDNLLDDERETEREQQLVGMTIVVYATQHIALDECTGETGHNGCEQQPDPEAAESRQCEADIGAEHVEPRVRKIEHTHHAEYQRKPGRYHEQQKAVDDTVQDRDDDVFHKRLRYVESRAAFRQLRNGERPARAKATGAANRSSKPPGPARPD